ncbi:MAG: hypothetical protein K9H84_03065 [Bacteroidales bacterium]|nr:hypothetical protein [Bacteroidales bacterium]
MRTFLRDLTLFTAGIFVLAILYNWLAPAELISQVMFYIIVFFYVLTIFVHRLLLKGNKYRFAQFNNRYILGTVIKILVMTVVMFVYSFEFPEDALNFLITFLILYLLFTAFEVVSIVKTIDKHDSLED